MSNSSPLDHTATAAEIIAYINHVKADPTQIDTLLALLPSHAAIYHARPASAIVRIRGHLLAAFQTTGLPTAAEPFVLHELKHSHTPFIIAGAAKALRGHPHPSPEHTAYLLRALNSILHIDDVITFDTTLRSHQARYTTALDELLCTLQWLGPLATDALPSLHGLRATAATLPTHTRQRITDTINAIPNRAARYPHIPATPFSGLSS